MQLECGEDWGVVAGHDIVGAAVRGVDDAGAWVGPPQHAVTVRRHVDANLKGKEKT